MLKNIVLKTFFAATVLFGTSSALAQYLAPQNLDVVSGLVQIIVNGGGGNDIYVDDNYVGVANVFGEYDWNSAGAANGYHSAYDCYYVTPAQQCDYNGYDSANGLYDAYECTQPANVYTCDSPVYFNVQTQLLDPKVFNATWYLQNYPDLAAALGGNLRLATNHWYNNGIQEGRQGILTFQASQYLPMYPDLVAAFGASNYQAAITHFVQFGSNEGRAGLFALRSEVFNASWYLQNYPDLQAAYGSNTTGVTQHWLLHGLNEGRQGSMTFSTQQYLAMYKDLTAAFGATNYTAALRHYISNGLSEGRAGLYVTRAQVFNPTWYLQKYPDLQAAFGTNTTLATQHWIQYGVKEGRQGSPTFWSQAYLANYADLRAAFGTNYAAAIQHYILYGINEGRHGL